MKWIIMVRDEKTGIELQASQILYPSRDAAMLEANRIKSLYVGCGVYVTSLTSRM